MAFSSLCPSLPRLHPKRRCRVEHAVNHLDAQSRRTEAANRHRTQRGKHRSTPKYVVRPIDNTPASDAVTPIIFALRLYHVPQVSGSNDIGSPKAADMSGCLLGSFFHASASLSRAFVHVLWWLTTLAFRTLCGDQDQSEHIPLSTLNPAAHTCRCDSSRSLTVLLIIKQGGSSLLLCPISLARNDSQFKRRTFSGSYSHCTNYNRTNTSAWLIRCTASMPGGAITPRRAFLACRSRVAC